LEPLASYSDNDHLIHPPLLFSPFSFSVWPPARDKEPCVHIPLQAPLQMLVCAVLFFCSCISVLVITGSFLRPFRVVSEAVYFS
jgi:hypothetical protein